jgi:hypothetical protein
MRVDLLIDLGQKYSRDLLTKELIVGFTQGTFLRPRKVALRPSAVLGGSSLFGFL